MESLEVGQGWESLILNINHVCAYVAWIEGHTWHSMPVEVRGELCGSGSHTKCYSVFMLAAEPSTRNIVFLCPLAISVGTSVQIWGQLRECVLSFHQVEPKDGIQFVRFAGSCRCLLSHLEGPLVFFYLHSDSFFFLKVD